MKIRTKEVTAFKRAEIKIRLDSPREVYSIWHMVDGHYEEKQRYCEMFGKKMPNYLVTLRDAIKPIYEKENRGTIFDELVSEDEYEEEQQA